MLTTLTSSYGAISPDERPGLAVAMVMGCGRAMMIMARGLIVSLETTRREYDEANRFAEVFAYR